jgi:hypothetical protein
MNEHQAAACTVGVCNCSMVRGAVEFVACSDRSHRSDCGLARYVYRGMILTTGAGLMTDMDRSPGSRNRLQKSCTWEQSCFPLRVASLL